MIGDRDDMKKFIDVLLGKTEFLMIAKRMVAILLIDSGKTDVEIARLLHVTRATASRFRTTFKMSADKPEGLKIVDQLKNDQQIKEFLERLKEYLLTAPFGRIPRRSIF